MLDIVWKELISLADENINRAALGRKLLFSSSMLLEILKLEVKE